MTLVQQKPLQKKSSKALGLLFKVTALFALPMGVVQASDFLVDTKWLQENLNNPNVRVIEVSVNPGQFERGHIPGAVNFKWHSDLVDTVRRDLVTPSQLESKLRQAGVNKDTTVVLYGDNNNWFAAWGAWVFDVYGIKNVKLLDGGRVKWEADKLPLSARSSSYKVGNISVNGKANSKLRARLPDVLQASNKNSAALVDIRSADEYNGKVFAPNGVQELSVRAGHIPGAVNVPWSQAVAADGTFKSKEELRKLYADVGIDGKKPIITYCRIGERSSHTWFALSKILGYEVKNYDGSWTEYGNTVGLPITNKAGTVWGAI